MIGRKHYSLLCLLWLALASAAADAATARSREPEPGPALARVDRDRIVIENKVFQMEWSLLKGRVTGSRLIERPAKKETRLSPELFILYFQGGRSLLSSSMEPQGAPRIETIPAAPAALKSADRVAGKEVILDLLDPKTNLTVTWTAILRDGSTYFRQTLALHAASDAAIREVALIDFKSAKAHVAGSVKGSPVVLDNLFMGFEHPLSACGVVHSQVTCSMHRDLPLRAGQSVTYSSVFGLSSPGQMRRCFLAYIERERARPYSPFLTYNSWYDIGYNNPYDEPAALDVIQAFGDELVRKRNVRLDSFLFDDGWDDPHTLWSFGRGFPNGFAPLSAAAGNYGSAVGVWLSPWGGYDQAKQERLTYGRLQGLETYSGGFALSGPKYFARFRDVTLNFLTSYKVNQFKIDGTGNVNRVLPGSQFDSDFEAAISLMAEWRLVNPSVFINLTTGTYPSPFWLQYADSIWRGGEDHDFAGIGSWRERWITYRDFATYKGIVRAGPLFPLNSLMLHGIIFARQANHLGSDPGNGFAHEVHSYFGSGTQMQELYLTHALLTAQDWDTLAEAARWARQNAGIQVDTHWIGGDPGRLQVYGWAAWSPQAGIITLRNPSDKPQKYILDLSKAWELPAWAPRRFQLRSPWIEDARRPILHLSTGRQRTLTLKPFEVINLEARPE